MRIMANNEERNYLEEMNKFKSDIKLEAESLVLKTFPRKVLELQNLLMSSKFSLKHLEKIKSDINIPIPEYAYVTNHISELNDKNVDLNSSPMNKKRKYISLNNNLDSTTNTGDKTVNDGSRVLVLPYGSVPCNKYILELVDLVKPLIRQLVDDTNLLKMWVQFLIPRIEDGNNFGVSIQEDTLSEIRTAETEASAYMDQMSRYFLSRARIVTKIAKYPHVDDFRRNVEEIDEKEFISLRLILAEIRNHYATLHDIVTKNLEKIKTPRNQNTGTMY